MAIFTHVTVGTNNLDAARGFYDTVLGEIGLKRITDLGENGSIWGKDAPSFFVLKPVNGQQATIGNGVTVAFEAPDRDSIHTFHDAALATLRALGDDVEIEGRQSYITVRRGRQFGLLVPATKSRIDLGLRFRSEPQHSRLAKAKNLGQCTHKVAITSIDDIDDDLVVLMRLAYEENG